MTICVVEGCERPVAGRGVCNRHYMKWWRGHSCDFEPKLVKAPKGTGCIDSNGYVKMTVNGKSTYEHIVLAEKALGRPLPKKCRVHHMKARNDNHGPFKLILCPDEEYHQLLHRRMKEIGYEDHKNS